MTADYEEFVLDHPVPGEPGFPRLAEEGSFELPADESPAFTPSPPPSFGAPPFITLDTPVVPVYPVYTGPKDWD